MSYKIHVLGLSGAGKTTMSNIIVDALHQHNKSVKWYNADAVRAKFNDWDFSEKGRNIQSVRMEQLASKSEEDYVICDFIAPTSDTRELFSADYTVWMDTIKTCKYDDTTKMFVPPTTYNYRISSFQNIHEQANTIIHSILGKKINYSLLSNTQLPERMHLVTDNSGMDSYSLCKNQKHFANYKKPIQYVYNSRGFRDNNWPSDNLKKAIWCLGDSFTVGLGQPYDETWQSMLETQTHTRTINISMDGASNDWIARQATEILNEIQPDNIVIQWSYSHRRELEDTSISDVSRRSPGDATNDLPNTPNLCNNIKMVNDNAVTTNIIHSFIPEFIPNCRIRYNLIIKILSYIYNTPSQIIPFVEQIDHARDYHHYDIQTTSKYVEEYIKLLK